MKKLFALVDCNSFYCSCETVFHPATRRRPVVVLSNNDGCAIAFNRKAKAIGFGEMCEPYYQIKDRIREHNVAVFSSNYALYDDMSKRVMEILTEFSPKTEVYSIDEAFLELDGMEGWDLWEYARKIRSAILMQTGIPVGVGIAPTKVLAKMANKMTKHRPDGVWVLQTPDEIDHMLHTYPLKDI